jgi:SAM-dependent methyltransferase
MKKFSEYQCVEGEPMSERDVQEVGSKFWNKGKWDNFVLPFLPKNCAGMTLVDMGCNAGLFLKLAEDKGFNVIGVDSDREAVKKALRYRKRNNGNYKILFEHMERVIHALPMADFTVLANSHYYFPISDWMDYVDELRTKTRYCIIVTAEKRPIIARASADLPSIRSYFRGWDEVGFIDELPLDGDPFPRRLWGICFKSNFIEREKLDKLDNGNNVQNNFYNELDNGIEPIKTRYGRILARYRKKWPEGKLDRFLGEKVELYESIKKCGLKKPLIVNSNGRVLDGNHRYAMLKHLGYDSSFVRKV